MNPHQVNPFGWVRCNRCFAAFLQQNLQLYLTNCLHIFCAPCIIRDEHTNAPKCPLCKVQIKLQAIDNQMPEQCKMLFHPRPWENPKYWLDAAKFQKKQRKHTTRALAITDVKLPQAEQMLASLKNDVKMVIKRREELRRERAYIEQYLNRFREEYRRRHLLQRSY